MNKNNFKDQVMDSLCIIAVMQCNHMKVLVKGWCLKIASARHVFINSSTGD